MSCSSPIRAVPALPWPCEPLVTRDPSARAHHLVPQRAWTPSKPKLTQKGLSTGSHRMGRRGDEQMGRRRRGQWIHGVISES